MPRIDTGVINFAVYEDAVEYYGMAEATLPELSAKAEEVSGAGIAGSFNAATLGHFDAMTLTLNFRTVQPAAIALSEPRDHLIDLRASQQIKDTRSQRLITQAVKHIIICQPIKFAPGKLAPASPGDASGEYACTYFATFIDGKRYTEIDILNFICFINGRDWLDTVRRDLGK